MRRSIQITGGLALAVVLAACGGTSAPATAPLSAPATVLAPPVATPRPYAASTVTPAASVPGSAAATGAVGSTKPRPSIDAAALAAYLTASVSLFDLTDGDVVVTVTYLDPSGGKPSPLGSYTLASSEQLSNALPPGRYRLDFHQPSTSATGSTCTIDVKERGVVTFVVVPGSIAVTRSGFKPATARDLFVATSSLCKP